MVANSGMVDYNKIHEDVAWLSYLKGEFHGSAHAPILTGMCTLSGTGPGFSLFVNQS